MGIKKMLRKMRTKKERALRVVGAAHALESYLRETGKDQDLTPTHDRLLRTLRGALSCMDEKFTETEDHDEP